MKTGVELIEEERARQIEEEGWIAEHDDQHNHGELALAAMAYIEADETDVDRSERLHSPAFAFWPWNSHWWKPKDRIRNLVRAGALIAAEIDRLNRDAARTQLARPGA